MTTKTFTAAAIALCMALLQPAALAQDGDVTGLAIDAGRLDAMMRKSAEILRIADVDETQLPPVEGEGQAYAALRDAVARYRRLVPIACHLGKVSGAFCSDAYAPSWLNDPVLPKAGEFRRRIDDATAHIAAFWDALCEPLRAQGENDACEIE